MGTLALLVVILYLIHRYTSLRKLQKRIELLEKKADVLEKQVKLLAFYSRDR